MTFDQDILDDFLELIRCDVKYTVKEFNELIMDLCISNFDKTPTTLFENLNEIGFQATPTKHGCLTIETNEKETISFIVSYNDSGITNIKLKEGING